jgi:hypothetical protein
MTTVARSATRKADFIMNGYFSVGFGSGKGQIELKKN